MTQEKVGKVARDLLLKADDKHTVVDQISENLRDYEKEFYICLERGKKLYSHNPHFFIEVQVKKERIMQNVIRHYFIPKIACPTPTWDTHVYMYRKIDDSVEYLWSIPDPQTCQYLVDFALQLPKEEKQLLEYVLDFRSGKLDEKAKRINGEGALSLELFKLN